MSLIDEVGHLTKIPIFSKIDLSKLKLLAFTSERLTFDAGQDLFQQGDIGDAAYIIIDGEADVLIESHEGGEIPVARLGKDKLIGEIAILIDVPRTATVRAVTQLTTLVISKELFLRMLQEFPEMGIEILRELAKRLEQTTAKLRQAHAAGK